MAAGIFQVAPGTIRSVRMLTKLSKFLRHTKAAVIPYVAVALALLLIIAGLAIDLGHVYVVKQELQSAADAGALAGARGMFDLQDQTNPTHPIKCDLAVSVAQATVTQNPSDYRNLTLPAEDVKVGMWEYTSGTWQFREAACSKDIAAVQVTTRRTAAVNGPVNLFFSRFLGKDSVELTARATAVLGWLTGLPPGFAFPLAIGEKYVPKNPNQRVPVTFSPDWGDTGGWHCFEEISADANELKRYINGTKPTPAIELNDYISVINGVAESVIQELAKALQNHGGTWLVYLPVIDATKMTQTREVLGFCAFEIQKVDKATKAVSGDALGIYMAPAQNQSPTPGANTKLRSNHPVLVQ